MAYFRHYVCSIVLCMLCTRECVISYLVTFSDYFQAFDSDVLDVAQPQADDVEHGHDPHSLPLY